MKPIRQHLICAAMIGGGMVAMAMAARPLADYEVLDYPINPLGVNRSPYGEIFAMAMQGPVDTFWHQGALAKLGSGGADESSCQICQHDHDHGHGCPHQSPQGKEPKSSGASLPWNQRLRVFLEDLEHASTARTNTQRGSKALDFHIRRQVENKLRFAYRLDPAHYGNYNSYHFFLSEPQVGTQRMLTPEVAQLARETIEYCLAEEHDPRPALTAAGAATNLMHLMFADRKNDSPIFTAAQMRENLDLLDHCIARHIAIREKWIAAGHDKLLSPMRLMEMEDRFAFVRRIRDAAEPAVVRFEAEDAEAKSASEK